MLFMVERHSTIAIFIHFLKPEVAPNFRKTIA